MPQVQFDDVVPADLWASLEGLRHFGLADWIKDPAKYVPPQPNLPRRGAGQSLTPSSIGAIVFFEELLHASSGDDD